MDSDYSEVSDNWAKDAESDEDRASDEWREWFENIYRND